MKRISESQLEIFRDIYGLQLFKPRQIQKDYLVKYRNAIYMGEMKNRKREGMGILLFNTGEVYFGEFKNDKMNDGKTFLKKYTKGVLCGVSSILKKNNKVKVVEFENGKMKEVLKNFQAQDDQFSKKLFDTIFEADHEAQREITQFSQHLAESMLEIFFGTFSVLEHGIYFGMIKHGQPSGFGIYFSDTGKIKIGWLRDGAMVGKARIIDSSGLIMDSTFKNDQAHGETLIYHIKKNDWKQISIDNDKVEEMDLGKGYPRFELNRANRWTRMVRKPDIEIDEEISTVVIDVNHVHELLLIYISGVTKRTFHIFDDNLGAKKLTFDHTQELSVGYSEKERSDIYEGKTTIGTGRVYKPIENSGERERDRPSPARSHGNQGTIKKMKFSESSICRSEKKLSAHDKLKTSQNETFLSNKRSSYSPRRRSRSSMKKSTMKKSTSKGKRSGSRVRFSVQNDNNRTFNTSIKQSIVLKSVKRKLKHRINLSGKKRKPYSPYEQRREIHERVRKKTTYTPKKCSSYRKPRRRVKVPKYVKRHVSPYSPHREHNIINRVPASRSIWRYTKKTIVEDPSKNWQNTFKKVTLKVESDIKKSNNLEEDLYKLTDKLYKRNSPLKKILTTKKGKNKIFSNLQGENFKYKFNKMKVKIFDQKKMEDKNMKIIRGMYNEIISHYLDFEQYEELLEKKDEEMGSKVYSEKVTEREQNEKITERKEEEESTSRFIKLTEEELYMFKQLGSLKEKRDYLEALKEERKKEERYTLKNPKNEPVSFRPLTKEVNGKKEKSRQNKRRGKYEMNLNISNVGFGESLDLKSSERFGEFNKIRLDLKYGDKNCRFGEKEQEEFRKLRLKKKNKKNLKENFNSGNVAKKSVNVQTSNRSLKSSRSGVGKNSRFMDSKIIF